MRSATLINLIALAGLLFAGRLHAQEPPPNAAVLVGDASTGFFGDNAITKRMAFAISNKARQRLRAKHWTVYENTRSDTTEIKNRIKSADIQFLMVISHGSQNLDPPPEYFPGVKGTDLDWVSPDDFVGQVFQTKRFVHFHACGQDLNQWKAHFPNAAFVSWSGSSSMLQVSSWLGFSYDYPEFAAGAQVQATSSQPPPTLHPSLAARCGYRDGDFQVAPLAHPQDPLFQMNSLLAQQFGNRTLNFYATDDVGSNPDILVGATISSGQIVAWEPLGYSSPDFEVKVTISALLEAFHDPLSLVTAYETPGAMTFTIFTVGPPERTLFDGTAAVFFGVGATDITDCQHATSIPTLSTGGVFALSIILLGLATLTLYRIPRLPG